MENVFGRKVTKESLRKYAEMKHDIAVLRKLIADNEAFYGKDEDLMPAEVLSDVKDARRKLERLEALIPAINDFTDNVINKCKDYWSRLSSYGFDSELLKYLVV